ncbi:unnamed protein product, partial [Laminaria digitata]
GGETKVEKEPEEAFYFKQVTGGECTVDAGRQQHKREPHEAQQGLQRPGRPGRPLRRAHQLCAPASKPSGAFVLACTGNIMDKYLQRVVASSATLAKT